MAPDFSLRNQDGAVISLGDFRGQLVVLYFYPRDNTYGCTREACSFRDDMEAFAKEGVVILGVSTDDVDSHKDFQRRHGLNFTLLADADGEVCRKYNALGILGIARRVTYVIDEGGNIRLAYEKVRTRQHAQEVLRDIRGLRGRLIQGAQGGLPVGR